MSTRPMEELGAAMRRVYHYTGDVNIEHGGMFYDLATFDKGYVDAVRVTPCSYAGGPDNMFWVERISIATYAEVEPEPYSGTGTLAMRRAHCALHDIAPAVRVERALGGCGWDENIDAWDKLGRAGKRHAIVQACASYGYYDVEGKWTVCIGPVQVPRSPHEWSSGGGEVTRLRANASLRTFARSKCG